MPPPLDYATPPASTPAGRGPSPVVLAKALLFLVGVPLGIAAVALLAIVLFFLVFGFPIQ
jgi:hypothetical protein